MSTTGNPKTNRAGIRLPANRSFERELAQLEAMSDHTPQGEDIERLRKSLGHENNYLVSKAARIVADNALMELLPDSLTAFNRFFKDPVKDDPQCWAKTSLAKALVKLQCRDVSVFLRGLNHRQEEPVWGGLSDTAGTLRATCALALAACDGLDDARLFDLLLTPFVDSDKTVRVEAARAIGHIGGVTAALLLKMRILLRKEEPEVLGACFSALLGLEGGDREGSIALVAEFLYEGEEAASEAAFALAETHNPIALKPLIVRRREGADAFLSSILDQAIVLSRLQEGMDFLLQMIEDDPRQAESTLEAISRVHISSEVRTRVKASVVRSGSELLLFAYRRYFPEDLRES